MDMNARNQYLKVLQGKYFMAKSRKEKSAILDEYCSNTHQNRKYVTRKIRSSISLVPKRRGGKEVVYDGYVKAALAKVGRSLIILVDKDLHHSLRPKWIDYDSWRKS